MKKLTPQQKRKQEIREMPNKSSRPKTVQARELASSGKISRGKNGGPITVTSGTL
jgi:hypothetical protein